MKSKQSTKLTYRAVLRLPPLPDDQYEGLRNNIAVNGVLVPILTDGGSPVRLIIDGNHRKQFADESAAWDRLTAAVSLVLGMS